ncbi:MAG TPA: XdhC family protein [Candidatus Ornithospirochaeta avicola]|uniref:XdhC family protein n=1 Tax=Candidatus Ornithospirochaeta avicola TaxID=2840896 RepID=A0A9D1PTE0_9SPIO|nr:XdhC family protein [Candidatus Ornithospirochaeta avicola]
MREYYKKLDNILRKNSAIRKVNISGEALFSLDGEILAATESFTDNEKTFSFITSYMPTICMLGAGHVAKAVFDTLSPLGFRFIIIDDRKEILTENRFPSASLICSSFSTLDYDFCKVTNPYFLVFTHAHLHDEEALSYVLKFKSHYYGMIGSERKIALTYSNMEKKGFSRETLDSVHSPVGVKINAETPEEIAISIAAEIIATYRKNKKTVFISSDLIKKIIEIDEDAVLAEIVSKKGSAPRGAGSFMIITQSSFFFTIGGGSLENQVISDARSILENRNDSMLKYYDMEEKGGLDMACGGKEEIMFRLIRKDV